MKAPAHRKVVGAKEDATGTPAQALESANSRTPHIRYPESDDSTTTYQKAGKGVRSRVTIMNDRTLVFVDDEPNVLSSLKRVIT